MRRHIIILLAIVIVFLVACTGLEEKKKRDININKKVMKVADCDREAISRSETISNIVVELYGIDDATTILLNDTALVGIILARDKEFTRDMENTIMNIIKKNDPRINHVILSCSKVLFRQIDDIIISILAGEPYRNHLLEIIEIREKMNNRN